MFGLAEAEARYPEEQAEHSNAIIWMGVFYLSYKVGGWLVEWAWVYVA